MYKYLTVKGLTVDDDKNAPSSFTDEDSIAGWAKNAVAFCRIKGFVSGDQTGRFNPGANATRAEAAVMIMKLYDAVN